MITSLDPRLDAQSPLRLIVWVVGALVAAAIVLTAIALLLEAQLRELAQAQSQMTISVLPAEDQNDSQIAELTTDLASVSGVLALKVLSRAELTDGIANLEATTDVWSTFQLPTIIELRYDPVAPPPIDAIEDRLSQVDPDFSIRDGSRDRADRASDLVMFQRVALVAIGVSFLGLIGIVAITTRSALASHYQTLDLLRTMGAEDRDLAHQFEAKASGPLLISAFVGFVVGLAGAGLLLLAPIGRSVAATGIGGLLDPVVVLMIVLVPVAAGSGLVMTIKLIARNYLRAMR